MTYQRRSVGGNGLYGYAKRMIGIGSIEKNVALIRTCVRY